MSDITYGLSDEKFYIRPVDYDGIFDRQSRARYKVNLLKDTRTEISSLEKAFCQVYQKTKTDVINKDANRDLLTRRRPGIASKPPFYIATMCIIGSLYYTLSNKEEPLRVSRIVEAVVYRNEDWNEAVDHFNSFFERDKSDDYSRIAVLYPGGKMALSFLLLGLQIICDLVKEVVVFEQAGRFVESAQVSNILGELGVDNMDVYLLMHSPDHPEREILLNAIEDHQNKHKLCFDSQGEWLIVNHLEIPRIRNNERNLALNEINTTLKSQDNTDPDEDKVITARIDEGINEPNTQTSQTYVAEDLKPEDYTVENEQVHEELPNEPEFGFGIEDDIDSQEEPSEPDIGVPANEEPEEPLDIDDTKEVDASKPDVDKETERYSARRRKKTISTSKESSTTGASLFKAPKNRNAIPINIDDI